MKIIIMLSLLLLPYPSMDAFGQMFFLVRAYKNIPQTVISKSEELGVDNLLELTRMEAAYIQALLKDGDKQELAGKRIAFFSGSLGANLVGKMSFFHIEKLILKDSTDVTPYPLGELYLFSASQIKESGGYDGAIVCGSKKLNSIKTMVKRLRKKSRRKEK